MTEPGTDQLIARVNGGDKSAWEVLVQRYTPLLWNVARSHHLSEEEADDVVQATWLRMIEMLPTMRVPSSLPALLATVARREAFRAAKTRRRELPVGDVELDDQPSESDPDPAITAERHERDVLLWRAVQQLPQSCQTLLRVLVQAERRSYHELAEALGVPVGSIGPTRQRCLAKLRQLLEVMAPEEVQGRRLRTVLATEDSLVRTLRETPRLLDAVPPQVVEDAMRIRDSD